jgi:hypothetical protein
MTVRRFPIQAFAVALLIAAALILGAASGYWLRSMSIPAASPATVVTAAAPTYHSQDPANLRGSSQGLFGSGDASGSSNADLSTHRSGIQY